jgi:flagellar protein FliL
MKKVLPILKVIGRGLVLVVMVSTVLLNLASAYIIFAPDKLPKPFYLLYSLPTPKSDETAEETPAPAEEEHPTSIEDIKTGEGIIIDTGTKIVNLAEPGGRKYIRVNVVLEFAPANLEYYGMPEEEKSAYHEKFNQEINGIMPVINDILITLLSSKTFEDVYTSNGKEALRGEILTRLNSKLPDYHVLSVYFTEFVVQ